MLKAKIEVKKNYLEKLQRLIFDTTGPIDLKAEGLENTYGDDVETFDAFFDDGVVAEVSIRQNEQGELGLSVIWIEDGDPYCEEPGCSYEAQSLEGAFYDNGKNTADGATHMFEIVGI